MEFTKIISSPVFACSAPDIGLKAQSAGDVTLKVSTPEFSWEIVLSTLKNSAGENLVTIRLRDILSSVTAAPSPSETDADAALPLLFVNLAASNSEGEQASTDIPVAYGNLSGKSPADFIGQWLTSREQVCRTYTWARERLSLIFGPQLLRWSGQVTLKIKCKAYFLSGSPETFELASVSSSENTYYTADCSYARIAALAESESPLVAWDLSYTLTGTDADGEPASLESYPQRFLLGRQDERIREFIFVNCFGMEDRVFGEGISKRKVDGSSTTFIAGGQKMEVYNDSETVFEAFSGQLADRRSIFHWHDFLSSATRLLLRPTDASLTRIVIDSHDSETEDFSVGGINFSYRLSDRHSDYPGGLYGSIGDYDPTQQFGALWVDKDPAAVTPEEGDLFFLKHRLSEFPSFNVADELLFLVQSPLTDAWGAFSVGNLKLWIGKFIDNGAKSIRLNALADYETSEGGVIDPAALQNGSIPVWDAAAGAYRPVPASKLGDFIAGKPLYPLIFEKAGKEVDRYTPDVQKTVLDISDVASAKVLSDHISDAAIHVTASEREAWNLVASLFGVDADGNVYVKGGKGFYGTSFVSARGSDPESGTSGGGGLDEDALWDILGTSGTEKIDASHLPAITASMIEGLTLASVAYAASSGTAGKVAHALTVNHDGGSSSASAKTFDGSAAVTVTIPTTLPASDVYAWAKAATKPSYTWSEIGGKPSVFTPAAHTHPLSEISDLHASWDALLKAAPAAFVTRWPAWGEVTGKPSAFTPAAHKHVKADITDFPTSWAWSAITGKPTTLAGYGITDGVNGAKATGGLSAAVNGHVLTIGVASGYAVPTSAQISAWNLVASLFGVDADGNVYVKGGKGFYGTSFVSARGSDPESGTSGGGGLDEDALWDILTSPGTEKIDASHLPAITASMIEGLTLASVAYAASSGTAGKVAHALTVKHDGGSSSASAKTFDGSAAVTVTIPTALPASDVYAWAKAATKPSYTWGEIDGKPSVFTPAAHTHPLSDLSDLHASWDALLKAAPSSYVTRWPAWGEVTGKPSTFTPSAHKHVKADITDFPSTWAWSAITGTPSTLAGYGITDGVNSVTASGGLSASVSGHRLTIGVASGYAVPTSAQVNAWSLVASLFGVDSDGNVYVKDGKGFYGTSFVSARGSDPESGSAGGGLDEDAMWDALAAPGGDVIDASHIPALSQLSGTLSNAQLVNSSVTVAGVKVALGGAVTTAQIASALTAANYKLTDVNTTYTLTKSGSTITLTGSDGSKTSVTDANTTYSLGSFGITATAAEINKLDGLATTKTELGYVHGVTSNIQTQLNAKANTSALDGKLNNGSTTYDTAYARNLTINGITYGIWAPANPSALGPFFAPSSAGANGYILQSTGGVPAWISRAALTQQLFTVNAGCVHIPENSDLNDYTAPGLYSCWANATVATIANVPYTAAFSLVVLQTAGVIQIFREYGYGSNANEYTRRYYDGTWTSWVRAPRLNELYTKTEADGRYLKLSGGTMTGNISARNIEVPSGCYIYSVLGESGGSMLGFSSGRTMLGSIGASTTAATHLRSITGHATIGSSDAATYNILDTGNYTSYTVTKTGGGASGTWPISISGNAASATNATNATNLAGVAGTKYLYHLRISGYNIDTVSTSNPRVIEINNPEGTPPTSNAWLQMLVWGSGDSGYGTQLANQYNIEGNMYFRNKVNGTWKPWRTLIDNSNYTSYTLNRDAIVSTIGVSGTDLVGWTYNGVARSRVTQAQLRTMLGLGSNAYTSTAYLPLAGGTMTGQLNGRGANFNTGNGATPFVISRGGLTKESVAISVNDSVARFDVTNDEASANLLFALSATDTESGGGAAAKTGYVNDILESNTIYTRYGYGGARRFRIGWNPNDGAYIENFTAGKWISITDTGSLLYNSDKIWHAGNDGAGSGLDADLLDGYHADGLSRLLSYISKVNITDAGWYRVYSLGNATDATGSNVILHLKRNFLYWDNEAYTFAITIAYNGGISITQLSGRANTRLIDKIRVVYLKNTLNSVFIDFHVSTTTQRNGYSVSGQGVGTFQSPAPVTETPANSVEFNTVNGVGSNLGFVGPLVGNADSATKLATARTLWGQSFNGTGNVDGSITVTSGYVYLKGGWFQNNVSGQGLYNAAVDARWCAGASGWTADKMINAQAGLSTTTINATSNVTVGTSGSLNLTKANSVGLLIDASLRNLSWTVDTSGGWARTLRATDPTGNTVLMNVAGIYGSAQTPNYVYMGGTSYTNAPLVVTYAGNVGIGTTSPSYKLSVVGTGFFSGVLVANGMTLPYGGSSWISMASTPAVLQAAMNQRTNSAHPLFRVKNSSGDAIVFGGLGSNTGFYGFTAERISSGGNNYDWATTWNVGTGLLTHKGAMTASGLLTASGGLTTPLYVQVGDARLKWDAAANALYVEKSDGTACGLYSKGYMSARGSDPEAATGGSSELVPVVTLSKLTVGTNVSISVLANAGLTNDVLEKMRDGAVGRVKAVFSDGSTEIWPVLHASEGFISFGYDTVAGGYQDIMNIYEITIPKKSTFIRVEHFER